MSEPQKEFCKFERGAEDVQHIIEFPKLKKGQVTANDDAAGIYGDEAPRESKRASAQIPRKAQAKE